MKGSEELERTLNKIDGKGYGAYKQLEGEYDLGKFYLFIEHVQGDPYAHPSRFSVRIDQDKAKFPEDLFENEVRKRALEDYITRRFFQAIKKIVEGNRGSGKSGLIKVVDFGQAVLKRSSCEVNKEYVEVIFNVGLPAKGRTVTSRIQAREMILDEIPRIAEETIIWENLPEREVVNHVETVEDSSFIRENLKEKGLVAFVAEGSILPRESGISDKPMRNAIPFNTPSSLETAFNTPNYGEIKGMGIPEGVTLIAGGGYHGKSTLLNALAKGVYDHIPGDGREFVVSLENSYVVRAEDGRFVENVDISPFISNIPSEMDTSHFSTQNASGSTSQAANILEALEAGAEVLLIDEDTSATNFMIRDERMQELVPKEKEPITPLIDKIKPLYDERGASTILVAGGNGDYFDVADTVIVMDHFFPREATKEAKRIVKKYKRERKTESRSGFGEIKDRIPDHKSINPRTNSGKIKIKARGRDGILFGYREIDLNKIHQIAENSQTRAIGDILFYSAKNLFDGKTTIRDSLNKIEGILHEKGLNEFLSHRSGDYAFPRRLEIASALNRLRGLRCKVK